MKIKNFINSYRKKPRFNNFEIVLRFIDIIYWCGLDPDWIIKIISKMFQNKILLIVVHELHLFIGFEVAHSVYYELYNCAPRTTTLMDWRKLKKATYF